MTQSVPPDYYDKKAKENKSKHLISFWSSMLNRATAKWKIEWYKRELNKAQRGE